MGKQFEILGLLAGYTIVILIGIIGFVVIKRMWTGEIDLKNIIAEPDGSGASISRFQFLLFSFVISMSLMWVILKTGQFPTEIPAGVFALLGISGGSYVISKGIHESARNDRSKIAGTGDGNPPKK